MSAARRGRWRPVGYWVLVLGILVVPGLVAWLGLRLLRSVERAPGAVARVLRIEAASADVLRQVTALESSRRGFALAATPQQLHDLEREHRRFHEALGILRQAVAGWPAAGARVDSAEAAVGSWADEFARPGSAARGARASLQGDRRLLGAAREQLQAVVADADAARRVAEAGVRAAHARVEWLWLLGTGVIVVAMGTYAELAYRRRARLAAAAREMDLLFGALPFALLSLDHEGRIRQATGRIHAVFGLTRREFLGRRLAALVSDADRAPTQAAIRSVLEGRAQRCEVVTRTEGAEARALAVLLAPIREDTSVVGASAVVHDVSTERALKAQVLQSDRLASVGALVAGVAHELNSPLSAITGFAELIDRSRLDEEGREAVGTIASEAKRAADIVRNLLDFSRQHVPERRPTDLKGVVARAVNLRRFELRSHGVELVGDSAGDLPAVLGDAQQLEQVFLNLLVNAEHAVKGQSRRRIAISFSSGDGGTVLVAIEDSGPGVPDDKRDLIFQPFYTTKPAGEGTGLGLALSRGIVAEHHGQIWVERGREGGARFVVELPTLPGGLAPVEPASVADPVLVHRRGPRGGSVLVVDDEPANRRSLGRLLERLGFSVTAAGNGQEALAAIEGAEFTLILSDVHMPILDGVELSRLVSERWPDLTTQLAFVSGGAEGDPVDRELSERGYPILRKPFDLGELEALLDRLSGTGRSGEAR